MSNVKPWQQRTYPDLAFTQAMLSVSPVQMHAMVEEAKELRTRVAELEAAAGFALEVIEQLADVIPETTPNCCCHISPPCNDCVENSHERALLDDARSVVKALRKAGVK